MYRRRTSWYNDTFAYPGRLCRTLNPTMTCPCAHNHAYHIFVHSSLQVIIYIYVVGHIVLKFNSEFNKDEQTI